MEAVTSIMKITRLFRITASHVSANTTSYISRNHRPVSSQVIVFMTDTLTFYIQYCYVFMFDISYIAVSIICIPGVSLFGTF
jgi:hypothetical protein